jgi:hypothetical protein
VVNSEGIPNSSRRIGKAGATILDVIGDTIIKSERTRVAVHRFEVDQFFGFSLEFPSAPSKK